MKIFLEEKSGEWAGRQKKKEKIGTAMGVYRRTREDIVKWNQMTALRLQTGERHQRSLASLQGFIKVKQICTQPYVTLQTSDIKSEHKQRAH